MTTVFNRRRVVELAPGRAQVTGQVVLAGAPLRAPISGRPCAFYQVIGTNHTWPWHDRRSYPPGGARFWMDDDQQLLIVVPPSGPSLGPLETEGALRCRLAGEVVRRTIYAGESPETDRLFEPVGYAPRPDAYVNVEERIVAAGETLTVIGDLVEELDLELQAPNFRTLPTRTSLRARSLSSVTG
jgi:hypothetical protein